MDSIISALSSFAVILPVIAAVGGAFFVYAVGFKPAEEPKFKKSYESSSKKPKQPKKEKVNPHEFSSQPFIYLLTLVDNIIF